MIFPEETTSPPTTVLEKAALNSNSSSERFKVGSTIELGGKKYTIEKSLGSGAISSVYRITDENGTPMALKVLRSDKAAVLRESEKAAGTANQLIAKVASQGGEADDNLLHELLTLNAKGEQGDVSGVIGTLTEPLVLQKLNKAQPENGPIVRLVGSGVTADGLPYNIQELAPPEYERTEIQSSAQELEVLQDLVQIVQAVQIAHTQGIALKDFDPLGHKEDRIRRDPDSGKITIIDWNNSGTSADFETDVRYLGQQLANILLQRYDGDRKLLSTSQLQLIPAFKQLNWGTRRLILRWVARDGDRYKELGQFAAELNSHIAICADIGNVLRTKAEPDRHILDRVNRYRAQGDYVAIVTAVDMVERAGKLTGEDFLVNLNALRTGALIEINKAQLQPVAALKTLVFTGSKGEGGVLEVAQNIIESTNNPTIKFSAELILAMFEWNRQITGGLSEEVTQIEKQIATFENEKLVDEKDTEIKRLTERMSNLEGTKKLIIAKSKEARFELLSLLTERKGSEALALLRGFRTQFDSQFPEFTQNNPDVLRLFERFERIAQAIVEQNTADELTADLSLKMRPMATIAEASKLIDLLRKSASHATGISELDAAPNLSIPEGVIFDTEKRIRSEIAQLVTAMRSSDQSTKQQAQVDLDDWQIQLSVVAADATHPFQRDAQGLRLAIQEALADPSGALQAKIEEVVAINQALQQQLEQQGGSAGENTALKEQVAKLETTNAQLTQQATELARQNQEAHNLVEQQRVQIRQLEQQLVEQQAKLESSKQAAVTLRERLQQAWSTQPLQPGGLVQPVREPGSPTPLAPAAVSESPQVFSTAIPEEPLAAGTMQTEPTPEPLTPPQPEVLYEPGSEAHWLAEALRNSGQRFFKDGRELGRADIINMLSAAPDQPIGGKIYELVTQVGGSIVEQDVLFHAMDRSACEILGIQNPLQELENQLNDLRSSNAPKADQLRVDGLLFTRRRDIYNKAYEKFRQQQTKN